MSGYPWERATGFDPAAVAAMSQAYEAACRVANLQTQEMCSAKFGIASRIIMAARSGVRDPDELTQAGLAGLTTDLET